jgi:hypothetical protein
MINFYELTKEGQIEIFTLWVAIVCFWLFLRFASLLVHLLGRLCIELLALRNESSNMSQGGSRKKMRRHMYYLFEDFYRSNNDSKQNIYSTYCSLLDRLVYSQDFTILPASKKSLCLRYQRYRAQTN